MTKLVTSKTQNLKVPKRTTDQSDPTKLETLTIADQALEQLQFDSEEIVHDQGSLETLDLWKGMM